jgi:hypothetical protein
MHARDAQPTAGQQLSRVSRRVQSDAVVRHLQAVAIWSKLDPDLSSPGAGVPLDVVQCFLADAE